MLTLLQRQTEREERENKKCVIGEEKREGVGLMEEILDTTVEGNRHIFVLF